VQVIRRNIFNIEVFAHQIQKPIMRRNLRFYRVRSREILTASFLFTELPQKKKGKNTTGNKMTKIVPKQPEQTLK